MIEDLFHESLALLLVNYSMPPVHGVSLHRVSSRLFQPCGNSLKRCLMQRNLRAETEAEVRLPVKRTPFTTPGMQIICPNDWKVLLPVDIQEKTRLLDHPQSC